MEIEKKNMELIIEKLKLNKFVLDYKKNGWIIIKNFFSKKEVGEAKKKINNFLKKNYKKYKGRDINFVGDEKNSPGLILFIDYTIINGLKI